MSAETLAEHIRPLKCRAAGTRARARFEPGRALAGCELREAALARLVPYLETLREAIPELSLYRRLYDRAWVVGLAADLPAGRFHGRPYSAWSRLELRLRVDVDSGAVEVECSSTVYDRDLPGERFEGLVTAPATEPAAADAAPAAGETAGGVAGAPDLDAFLEHQALLFATRFFQAAPRERWRAAAA